jgi:hypothetical protein
LTSESYLPAWLRDWSNSYFNADRRSFRTIWFLLEAVPLRMKKSKKSINTFGSWFKNGCISTAVVCLAEGGQFFILNRHPDAMDVLFGIVGNQMGLLYFSFFKALEPH